MAASVLSYSEARDNFLRHCRGELGKDQYEFPVGSNKTAYGKEYGWDGVYWCVIFLWAMCNRSGNNAAMPKTASTGAVMRWAKSMGRWRETPAPGYFAIHVNSKGATVHVEAVEAGVYQIGGNTSKGTSGSLANGIWVARNNRAKLRENGRIIGYVAPFFGLTTDLVKELQSKLGGLKVDGAFGPNSLAKVKEYQKANGLTVDGYPGPNFFAKLRGGSTPTPVPSKPAETPKVTAPAYPLPSGYYYGQASGPKESVSGKGRNSAVPSDVVQINGRWFSKGLMAAQLKLRERGWKLYVDGRFGGQTEKVIRQYQSNKGLSVDGKLGPKTWESIFTSPVK